MARTMMGKEIKKGTIVATKNRYGMWDTEVYNILGTLIRSYSLDNTLSALKEVSGIRMWKIDLKEGTVTAMEDDNLGISQDSSTKEKPYEWWKEEQTELDLY